MRHHFGLQQYIRLFVIVNITTYTTYHGAQEGEYEEGCRQCKSSPLQSQYMECLLISIQKAEVAAQKQAQASAQVAAKEDQEWNKGAKSNAKK